MYRRKTFNTLISLMLVLTGLTMIGFYATRDLYHLLKYHGTEYHYVFYSTARFETWIKPILFVLCGILRLTKKKEAYPYVSLFLLLYYLAHQYYSDVQILKMAYHLETIAVAGLFISSIIEYSGFLELNIDWKLFTLSQTLSLLLALIDDAGSAFLSERISDLLFLIYKIPFLSALVLSGKMLKERRRYMHD